MVEMKFYAVRWAVTAENVLALISMCVIFVLVFERCAAVLIAEYETKKSAAAVAAALVIPVCSFRYFFF